MKTNKIKYLIFATLFFLSIPGFAFAQTAAGQNSVEKVVQEPPPKFKVKLFEIKHRNPESLRLALYALGSGAHGAEISSNNQLRTLTVRDYSDNIAAIEEANELPRSKLRGIRIAEAAFCPAISACEMFDNSLL
ncbi:MAG: hypothetical protein L0220_01050, partial [Acidobacteria bacterium]|nr:hypothetical protein [Acidobacteriota bacterium]